MRKTDKIAKEYLKKSFLRHIDKGGNKMKLPKGAVRIHLYDFSNVLRPRGHMKKESLGDYLLERLHSAHESWTDPEYGDNPDEIPLLKILQRNMKEEVDGAWKKFIKQIDK